MQTLPHKTTRLSGWGGYPAAECTLVRPEKSKDIDRLWTEQTRLIARGLGRSYGDASLGTGITILSERLDRCLGFDTKTGVIRVQAGVSLGDILDMAIPKGWILPVIPGTRHVSAGGAFACNVHGKNHFKVGDFAEHVTAITLRIANGSRVECTPNQNGHIFWATAGGMGLTGLIEELTIKLRPIASRSLRTKTRKVSGVQEMIVEFEMHRDEADYMVGWIDHAASEAKLGRGVFEMATHISEAERGKPCKSYRPFKTKFNVPGYAPSFLLNRYSMALYNAWRFRRYSSKWREQTVTFDGFFHPLDSIGHWNRLYGKRGFLQYQFVLPDRKDIGLHLRGLLEQMQQRGVLSFLAVLKYHRAPKGVLTFPLAGYSLALDIPNTPRARDALADLNTRVKALGGRVYLAKDAVLTTADFEAMYSNTLSAWNEVVRRVDPEERFASALSKRIKMRW